MSLINPFGFVLGIADDSRDLRVDKRFRPLKLLANGGPIV